MLRISCGLPVLCRAIFFLNTEQWKTNMLYMRKFFDELATIHLMPDEIDLHKVPSEQEFRKACYDDIASSFMNACAAISPEMAEEFRREQEEQERRKQEAITDLEAVFAAHFADNRTEWKNGQNKNQTASP